MANRKIAFIVTNAGNINAICKGKAYPIPFDHANYEKIKQALIADDEDEFATQADVAKAVTQFTAAATAENVGEVTVKDGQVYWNGAVVHSVVADKILMLMNNGFPFEPMMRFMGNLLKNPSYRAVTELYTFLDRQGLPITEDGCFLGYKRVNADYTDCHTGTVSNKIGEIPTMPRNTVDDNWANLCSSGFHVGSIEYVRDFCNEDENHVMIVKVNPADVVSVPSSENTKLRTCKYEVVSEYDKKLITPMQSTLHTAAGVPVDSQKTGFTAADWEELEDIDEEEEEQDTINRLTLVAEANKVNPYQLAYALRLGDIGDSPTLRQIITEAVYDGQSDTWIAEKIANCSTS